MLNTIARHVRDGGATILRGGAFKPRTSPYSFQGHGETALKWMRACGDELGMPICTEVMDTRQVELIERYTDMFQIGARNMQNFDLLREVGKTRKAVLLKRGLAATVKDWLLSAEYVLSQGNGVGHPVRAGHQDLRGQHPLHDGHQLDSGGAGNGRTCR